MFAFTVVSVFLGMHLFAWVRLQRQMRFTWKIFWAGTVLCLPLSLSIIYGYLVPETWPAWAIRSVWQTTYFWVGFTFYLFSVQLAALLLEISARIIFPRKYAAIKKGLGIVAVPAALFILCAGYFLASLPPQITRYTIESPKIDSPLKIALVADNHLGIQTRLTETERLAAALRDEEPDLCLFAGDIFNDHPGFLDPHLDILASLDFPSGKYAILGNHEIYFGKDQAVRKIKGMNIKLIQNSVFSVPGTGIQIAGVDDPAGNREKEGIFLRNLENALRDAAQDRFTILITHRPEGMEAAAELGADLQVSGHTHYGQIFPFNFLVRIAYPHIYGRYREGGMTLIVTRGLGTWGPSARFPFPGEIVIINIRPGNEEDIHE
jgi:predicted MPP superfamily phosphohydrolase